MIQSSTIVLYHALIGFDSGSREQLNAARPAARARRLGLCEASALARGGYKGWTALDWLRDQGVGVPEQNNRARRHDGALVARLADTEALILGGLDGACALLDDLGAAPPPDGCYPVPRADANVAFVISGSDAPAMLAKLCAVDLRLQSFPDMSVAQTSLARLNVILLREDIADTVAFHCLFDSASALYLWHCLIDTMAEFDGRPVSVSPPCANYSPTPGHGPRDQVRRIVLHLRSGLIRPSARPFAMSSYGPATLSKRFHPMMRGRYPHKLGGNW